MNNFDVYILMSAFRPRTSLPRTPLLATEQSAEISCAVGQRNGDTRYENDIPQRAEIPMAIGQRNGDTRYDSDTRRSAIECLSPRLSQRRLVFSFLRGEGGYFWRLHLWIWIACFFITSNFLRI